VAGARNSWNQGVDSAHRLVVSSLLESDGEHAARTAARTGTSPIRADTCVQVAAQVRQLQAFWICCGWVSACSRGLFIPTSRGADGSTRWTVPRLRLPWQKHR